MKFTPQIGLAGHWGSGKTRALCTVLLPDGTRPGKMILVDMEHGKADAQLQIFDDIERIPMAAPADLYNIIPALNGAEVFLVDNATRFQDLVVEAVKNQSSDWLLNLARTWGVQNSHVFNEISRGLIKSDANMWDVVNNLILALVTTMRKNEIMGVYTFELKNVWQNFGSRSRDEDEKMKIIGYTAKMLDGFHQSLDAVYELMRPEGAPFLLTRPQKNRKNEDVGTAAIKNGLLPMDYFANIHFKNWVVFWEKYNEGLDIAKKQGHAEMLGLPAPEVEIESEELDIEVPEIEETENS